MQRRAWTRGVARLHDQLRAPLRQAERLYVVAARPLRPGGGIAAPWSTHRMVWWGTLLVGLVLLLTLL